MIEEEEEEEFYKLLQCTVDVANMTNMGKITTWSKVIASTL